MTRTRNGWLLLALLAPSLGAAAEWYWRPNEGSYGDQSGTSYRDAWSTEEQIRWDRMRQGDTLFICGRHDTGYRDRSLATGRADVTISGACPGDPGELVSVGTRFLPQQWTGPGPGGVYRASYSGSPSIAMDEIGQLRRLATVPDADSPCRSYHHAAGVLYYKPCGPPLRFYPTGGSPVVSIRHDGVTLEHLSIRNGGSGVEVRDAAGVTLRRLRVWEHSGIGIILAGRTRGGAIRSSEIHDVTDGIYAVAAGGGASTDRHDGWTVEGNLIHDISGSGDSHGIGWQSGSDNVFRRNFILRAAGSGITIYAWRDKENSRNLIEGNVILEVVRKAGESNQRGVELSGDSCWTSPGLRRGDVIRDNYIEDVAEGVYVKAMAGADSGVLVEGNHIRARQTGVRWANPSGGPAPELVVRDNDIIAPRPLHPVNSRRLDCR